MDELIKRTDELRNELFILENFTGAYRTSLLLNNKDKYDKLLSLEDDFFTILRKIFNLLPDTHEQRVYFITRLSFDNKCLNQFLNIIIISKLLDTIPLELITKLLDQLKQALNFLKDLIDKAK